MLRGQKRRVTTQPYPQLFDDAAAACDWVVE